MRGFRCSWFLTAVLVGALLSLGACGGNGNPAAPPVIQSENLSASSRDMIRLVDSLHQQTTVHPEQYYYLNSLRAEQILDQWQEAPASEKPALQFAYAAELLYAGQTSQAIDQLKRLQAEQEETYTVHTPEGRNLLDLLGIAYLRLAEQENCLEHGSAEACILPIQGAGIHQEKRHARSAIEVYTNLLDAYRRDFRSRWLLNLSHMVLGEYPDLVDRQLQVPGVRGTSTFRYFENVEPALGLSTEGLAGGVVMEDFNNDGLLDLFITKHRLNDTVRLYFNDGMGAFVDQTEAAGLSGMPGGLNVVHADYNNDGYADIFILRGAWLGVNGAHPNSLLRNNGDGSFTDVTEEAGLLSFHPTQTATWVDVNLDGWLDLFIGNELSNRWLSVWQQSTPVGNEQSHASELYISNGDGTFSEQASAVGLDVRLFVKGATFGDVNNDGWPDLYVSVMGGPNRLFVNRGVVEGVLQPFDEAGGIAGVHEPFFSFPVWFWDFDNDGWLDIMAGNSDLRRLNEAGADLAREFLDLPHQTEMPRLYRNSGDGTYQDVTEASGMNRILFAMGSNFGDLDNDGWLDAYFGTGAPDYRSLVPNRLFRNAMGVSFEEVTFDAGMGHLQKGHGVAFGDVDRDGDQDVYAVMGGAYEGDVFHDAFFENPGSDDASTWITLKLEGVTANRDAIGARVHILARREDGSAQSFHHLIGTGGSFGSSSLQLEAGLGSTTSIEQVEVIWPNSEQDVQVFSGLEAGRFYLLKQGEDEVVLNYPVVPLRRVDSTHQHASE